MKKALPSPAMVVALIALGVALGGTSVAATGLVTGAQIKDHSIGLNDLAPSAVARLHGARGATGPAGPAGAAGAPGVVDPSKVTFQTSGPQSISPGQVGNATALCPTGSFVVSGGGFTNGQDLWASAPAAVGSQSGWTAGAHAYSTQTSTITAYAICVTR